MKTVCRHKSMTRKGKIDDSGGPAQNPQSPFGGAHHEMNDLVPPEAR